MKTLARMSCLALLALFSSLASAETVTLYFADGTTAQREVTISKIDKDAAMMQLADRGIGGISLSTTVRMSETVDFQEIVAAAPGQEVNLSTRFTALGQLDIPFQALVGRVFISALIAPQLDIFEVIQIQLEADDDNVIGYGRNVVIPAGAPNGPFLLVGLNRIAGIATTDNTATLPRLIAGGTAR
ncbi:MAG: hypothetical protein AAFN78_18440 [Pseudomonadota bacterium]